MSVATNTIPLCSRQYYGSSSYNPQLRVDIEREKESALADLEADIDDMRYRFLRILRLLFVTLIPLTIVSCFFATTYGWIYVRSTNYKPDKKYEGTYTPDEWQSCIAYTLTPYASPQMFPITMAASGGQMFIFLGKPMCHGYHHLRHHRQYYYYYYYYY